MTTDELARKSSGSSVTQVSLNSKKKRTIKRKVRRNKKRSKFSQLELVTKNLGVSSINQYLEVSASFYMMSLAPKMLNCYV